MFDLKTLIADKSKPLVAVITPGSLPVPPILGGGIQTVVYDYALKNTAQNMVIVSAEDGGLAKFDLDKEGIGHIRIANKSYHNLEIIWNGNYLFRYNSYIYKACNLLKKLKPDVVHIHNRPHFAVIARKILGKKVKIILTNHNTKIAEDSYVLKRLDEIMDSLDKVIYPSRRISELDLTEKHPQYKDKVAIIYNGVDETFYKQYPEEITEKIRKKYSLNSQKIILFVGRLVKEKAVDKVLEAMPHLLQEEKDATLVIVGSSFFGKGKKTPYVKELIKLAEPIKNSVRFTGYIETEDLPVLYSLANLFVSPVNWDDPSPKTIYEAAACETAILSTKRGGIPEIVVDGESAVLIDSPYEIKELADTIISMLREPDNCKTLGTNARLRMLENFTVDIISKKWEEAYNKLLR